MNRYLHALFGEKSLGDLLEPRLAKGMCIGGHDMMLYVTSIHVKGKAMLFLSTAFTHNYICRLFLGDVVNPVKNHQ